MMRYVVFFSLIIALSHNSVSADTFQPPVTYHLSFDTFDFLDDDINTRFLEPTLEQRKLSLVEGKFGQALHNGAIFDLDSFRKSDMSASDLDTLLEVIVHQLFAQWKNFQIGRNEPYIWGTGRLSTDGGCVAFWAKGSRDYRKYLFFQSSSSFGRFEKYLLAIEIEEDGSLSAFIRDARYDYHTIRSGPVWNPDAFNHVALVWDRAHGLALYLNGKEIASNWGDDAWWATQIPGLFHMPMGNSTCDELWIFDRPLSTGEILRLMEDNEPPSRKTPPSIDSAAADRLSRAFIGDGVGELPAIRPFDGSRVTTFNEVFPVWAGDGIMSAPYVMDGKYELAWPQDYTSFTSILGDSDFHASKVDFRLPEGADVNYVTMEGNLTDVRMQYGCPERGDTMEDLLSVPGDGRFFHGAAVEPIENGVYRIPFVEGYGSPPGYEPGLNLPLTGEKRIHEVSFFSVREDSADRSPSQSLTLYLSPAISPPDEGRYGFALRALNDARNKGVFALSDTVPSRRNRISTEPFTRINLFSEPFESTKTIAALDIAFELDGIDDGDYFVARLHDPGVPARIWTKVVCRLEGFERSGTMRLRLDVTDLNVAPGDRLWLDLTFSGGAVLATGGENGSTVTIETLPLGRGDGRYAEKALQPALGDFSKANYWYFPWMQLGDEVDLERPVTFGGFYDIIYYPLAVVRTVPDHFVANTVLDLSNIGVSDRSGYARTSNVWAGSNEERDKIRNSGGTTEGVHLLSRDMSPGLWPPVRSEPADGSPEWAYFMRYYLTRHKDIVDWFAERQNPDGQVGGGWNDDVLFASRLPCIFLYTGYGKARTLFDRIFEGLEETRMFRDGYCNIQPMDHVHVQDLVRNRFEGLLFEPGDPHKMLLSMRTARRFGKPEETPVNYGTGKSFLYDHDLIRWYWGETPDYPPYRATREQVTETAVKFAPAMDEVNRFRYTEARKFTDTSNMPGSREMRLLQIGGLPGPFLNNLTLAVTWERGGEPAIPKWVESATDTSFVAHLYSYDMVEREVTARFYRLRKGRYRITLACEGDDESVGKIMERETVLKRFSELSFPVRPHRELVLTVHLLEPLHVPERLPDLAVADSQIEGDTVTAVVYNFGNGPAENIAVALEDPLGRSRSETVIERLGSAEDFAPEKRTVSFHVPGAGSGWRIRIDAGDRIEEIYEGNNDAVLKAAKQD